MTRWKDIGIRELALIVSCALKKSGMDAVLVGGACVSIYTKNRYISYDLDFVSGFPLSELAPVMKTIGFKLIGRHFKRPDCRFLVEFPPPPVSLGNEIPVKKFRKIRTLTLFTPTDCVKDRLAAFYHWNDPQSLAQAVMVAKTQPVNMGNISRWSRNEGAQEKFKRFRSLLMKERKKKSGGSK